MTIEKKHITMEELQAFNLGDRVRLIPLEEPGEYKYYSMPGRPTEMIVMSIPTPLTVLGDPYTEVRLWFPRKPDADKDKGISLSYVDREDDEACRTLFFNGESTCETHGYVMELVEEVSDPLESKGIRAAREIILKAEPAHEDLDYFDFVQVAIRDAVIKKLSHVENYLDKRVKELAMREHYPVMY